MAIQPGLLMAILPLAGALCGIVLQSVLSRSTEAYKHERSIRHQAYADYLRIAAKLAFAQTQEEREKALGELVDAKARIAIYGTSSVVNALAEFEGIGASLESEQGQAAFLHLILKMRERKKDVSASSLRQVLLRKRRGRELPDSPQPTAVLREVYVGANPSRQCANLPVDHA